MKKLRDNKNIKMDVAFLPKRKRVLNKRALSVLNSRAKKRKGGSQALLDSQSSTSASLLKKPFHDDATHDDLLDSQCSVSSCFMEKKKEVSSQALLDSQSSVSASFLKKPFHDPTHDDLLGSQCSVSSCFVDFSQSQTPVSSSSPVKQAAQQPSKCTLACHFC